MLAHVNFQKKNWNASSLTKLAFLLGFFFLSACGKDDASEEPQAGSRSLIVKGVKNMKENNYEGAKMAFGELLNRDINDLEARSYMALLMAKQGRRRDAIMHAERVLEADPKRALPHAALGLVYFSANQFDRALEHSRKALKANPDLPDPYLVIGEIYLRRGKVKKSLPVLKHALQLDPKNTEAYKKMAAAQIKADDYKAAFETLQKAMEIDPDIAGIHFNLALVYSEFNDADKAMHHIDTAERFYIRDDNSRWSAKTRQIKQLLAKKFKMRPEDIGG
ncbi:MAG: tetratricopeptide repeat protein [Nitrospinae bacterium]|nr:tetratricopeptide repeat protein [Nitrospinota bacterium]